MNKKLGPFKFAGYEGDLIVGRFGKDGPLALAFWTDEGEPIATCSVHIPTHNLSFSHCTLIKDYAENEGMLEALKEWGYVSETGIEVPTGFVTVHEVEILGLGDNIDGKDKGITY